MKYFSNITSGKIYFRYFLLVLFLFPNSILTAQDIEPNIKIPSIPSAFSFEKYGDIPVGLSTGTANVSIPIYNINYKDFSFPLSLSYHTSGVKVDENNPDIGLGWNLNFGGMVSCSVKGLYDHDQIGAGNGIQSNMDQLYANYFKGFADSSSAGEGLPLGEGGDLSNYLIPSRSGGAAFYSYQSNRGYMYADDVYNNLYDGAPDVFSYYFLNKNGKFIYNGSLKPHTIPYDDVKIEKLSGISGFKITDKKGVQFEFQEIEVIESYETLNVSVSYPFINAGGSTKNRNWKLSKIIFLDGEEINFEYDPIAYSYYSDSAIKYEHIMSAVGNVSDAIQNFSMKIDVAGKRLKRITTTFDNQSILFTYGEINNAGDEIKPLSGVAVMNSSDEIKKINFSHSAPKRFVLDSINEEGLPGHHFEYNNIQDFPEKNSIKRDLWGYYNQNVYSLLNNDIINNDLFTGADKTPDFNSTLTGSLKKITYPTGGSTEFVYEQNQYFGTEKRMHEIPGGSVTFDESDYGTVVESIPFTIPSVRTVNLHGNINRLTSYPTGFVPPPGTIIQIKNTSTNNVVCQLQLTEENVGWPFQIVEDYKLQAGTYVLTVQNFVEEIKGDFNVTWIDSYDFEGNLNAGGLRIIELIDKPNENSLGITKQYSYNDPITEISSGYLPGEIKTSNGVTLYSISSSGNFVTSAPHIKRTSNSMYDIGNVSYQYVTEIKEEHKSIHEFTKFKDVLLNYDWELVPNIDFSWLRNIPLKTNFLKKGDTGYFPIKKEVYNYANLDYVPSPFSTFYNNSIDTYRESLIGFNIRAREPVVYNGLLSIPANYTVVPYYTPTNWIYKNNTITTQYDSNGLNPIITEVNYYYDNPDHLQLTRAETTTSEGDQIKTQIYFPDDVINSTVLGDIDIISLEEFNAIDSLKSVNQHRISEPVQVESYKNDVLLSTQRTNYKDWGVNSVGIGNRVLPETIQTAKGEITSTNLLEDRLVYYNYDPHGNPTEVSKKGGTKIYYVWGYNQTQPIAKIERYTNSQIASIQSLITAAITASDSDDDRCLDSEVCNEKNLRTALTNLRNSLPNALVSTYTYDPLIGVTSITDPRGETIYYEYDEFNRLKFVKDSAGNILRKNEYHYKNQQ